MGCRVSDKPKMNYRKGLWSPEEDQRLRDYILKNGLGCWSAVPVKAGLQRNGKSCRLRWINYLRPGLKRGIFSPEEEEIVMTLQAQLGNKWSQIAMHLPGRTDNEVKNHWNSYLKKRVTKAHGPTSKTQPTNGPPGPSSMLSPSQSIMANPNFVSPKKEACQLTQLNSISDPSRCSDNSNAPSPANKAIFSDWLPTEVGHSMSLTNWDLTSAQLALEGAKVNYGNYCTTEIGDLCAYGGIQGQNGNLDSSTKGGNINGVGGGGGGGGGLFDLLSMGEIYGGLNINSNDNDNMFF